MKYTVKTAKVGDVKDLQHLTSGDVYTYLYEAAKRLIIKDGQPIGEALDDMDNEDYMKLMPDVMKAVGFGGDDEGK